MTRYRFEVRFTTTDNVFVVEYLSSEYEFAFHMAIRMAFEEASSVDEVESIKCVGMINPRL